MGWIDNIGILKGNSVAGLHLTLLEDGGWNISGIVLKKKKKIVNITKAQNDFQLSDLAEFVPASVPLVLSIDGKGIIHRMVKEVDNSSPVLQVFPNAQQDDFIVQAQAIESGKTYISLARKEVVDEIISSMSGKGYYIIKLFLGPFSVDHCLSLFEQQQGLIHTGNYTIHYSDKMITQVELSGVPQSDKNLVLGKENLDAWQLVPYADALSFFTGFDTKLSITTSKAESLFKEYLYRHAYRYTAAGMLCLLFVALLVNFMLYDKYNRRFNDLSIEYKSGMELIHKLEQLKTDLNLRETLIGESGLLEQSRLSFYADKIASLVPQHIVLTRMEINPLMAKPKIDKQVTFTSKILLITGKCRFSIDVDNWIEIIKQEKWVNKLEVMQYKQENQDTPGEFILKIEMQ